MTILARPDPGIAAAASPVMAQYFEIKKANPGCLLFFRMGDFFELFFDDAVAAAQALDIALTKRGRHDGADIPMCGVPVHTAETYLARLIRAGFIILSGGPIAIALATLVGAGLGGAAIKELFDDFTAPRHSEDFQAALQAGAALLWVRCDDPEREAIATRILEETGGRHVHVHGRTLDPGSGA